MTNVKGKYIIWIHLRGLISRLVKTSHLTQSLSNPSLLLTLNLMDHSLFPILTVDWLINQESFWWLVINHQSWHVAEPSLGHLFDRSLAFLVARSFFLFLFLNLFPDSSPFLLFFTLSRESRFKIQRFLVTWEAYTLPKNKKEIKIHTGYWIFIWLIKKNLSCLKDNQIYMWMCVHNTIVLILH